MTPVGRDLYDDALTLRLCVGQTHTEARHVEGAWQRIQAAAEAAEAESA